MELKNVDKYLGDLGKQLVTNLKSSLKQHDHRDTGNLERSIRYSIVKDGKSTKLTVYALSYGEVLDIGASGSLTSIPGTPYKIVPSRSGSKITGHLVKSDWKDIRKWVKRKGIKFPGVSQNSTSYLINRKIKRHGIQPSYWLKKGTNKTLSNKKYVNDVAASFRQDIIANFRLLNKTMK